jgi:hypothetical protein
MYRPVMNASSRHSRSGSSECMMAFRIAGSPPMIAH